MFWYHILYYILSIYPCGAFRLQFFEGTTQPKTPAWVTWHAYYIVPPFGWAKRRPLPQRAGSEDLQLRVRCAAAAAPHPWVIWNRTENGRKSGCTKNFPQCSTQSRTNPNKGLFNREIIQNYHIFASFDPPKMHSLMTPVKGYNDTTWKETTRSRPNTYIPMLSPTASKRPCTVAKKCGGSHSKGSVSVCKPSSARKGGVESGKVLIRAGTETWNNNLYYHNTNITEGAKHAYPYYPKTAPRHHGPLCATYMPIFWPSWFLACNASHTMRHCKCKPVQASFSSCLGQLFSKIFNFSCVLLPLLIWLLNAWAK